MRIYLSAGYRKPEKVDVSMIDISNGGLSLMFERFIRIGQRFAAEFVIGEKLVTEVCQVRNCRIVGPRQWIIGASFVQAIRYRPLLKPRPDLPRIEN